MSLECLIIRVIRLTSTLFNRVRKEFLRSEYYRIYILDFISLNIYMSSVMTRRTSVLQSEFKVTEKQFNGKTMTFLSNVTANIYTIKFICIFQLHVTSSTPV